MKFSIVTISFNQARFLERAMRSVLDQEGVEVEYIVVDPGSTDGSREIIERYRDRLARVIFEPDRGPADGLNKGFRHATGDVCGYLNSDDELLPGALKRVAHAFARRPDVDLVYGHGYIADETGRIVRRLRSGRFGLRNYAYGAAIVVQQSTFFRRQAFLDAGGFNAENKTCWDAELVVDCALAGKTLLRINEYLSLFRIYGESISGSGRLQARHEQERARIFAKITKRRPVASDRIRKVAYRVGNLMLDPARVGVRLQDLARVKLSQQ